MPELIINPDKRQQQVYLALTAASTVMALWISILCLANGYYIIYQNLFYLPIIISCYYFYKKGFLFSIALSLLYFALNAYFIEKFDTVIYQVTVRTIMFIFIGGIIAVISGINKKTSDSLRDSEKKYRSIAQLTSDYATAYILAEGKNYSAVWLNETLGSITGYTIDEIEESGGLYFLVEHDDRDIYASLFTELLAGIKCRGDLRLRKKSGEPVWVLFEGHPGEDSGMPGKPVCYIMLKDITEEKKSEFHKELLAEIAENAPSSITVHDVDGNFLYANDKALQIHGYTMDEFLRLNLFDLDVPESREKIAYRMNLIDSEGEASFEVSHHRKDGSSFPLEIFAKKIKWNGQPAMLSIATDISERRKSNEAIRNLLTEKETLLKEVHHRVKNNMSSIAGLLDLQINSLKGDSAAASALSESRNRVTTMLKIYELLSASGDYRNIQVNLYFKELISSIESSFSSPHVRIETDIQNFIMRADRLFPVGIIINELITNSYKYAFPDSRDGAIKIKLTRSSDGKISLAISDNGSGSSEIISSASTGLGLQLVSMLTAQLKGVISKLSGPGTSYEIKFTE